MFSKLEIWGIYLWSKKMMRRKFVFLSMWTLLCKRAFVLMIVRNLIMWDRYQWAIWAWEIIRIKWFILSYPDSGPREDATRIGSAGVVRRQAVDISPLRRVNQAIYLLTTGARESAFRNIKTIAECLADELVNAAKGSSNRYELFYHLWWCVFFKFQLP